MRRVECAVQRLQPENRQLVSIGLEVQLEGFRLRCTRAHTVNQLFIRMRQ